MLPLAPQLIRALVEACRADRSAAVRKSYAAAAAQLCRFVTAARASKFVSDALASLADEAADRDDRYVAGGWRAGAGPFVRQRCGVVAAAVAPCYPSERCCTAPPAGLLLRELGREAADVLAAHASEVAPPAFMAQASGGGGACVSWLSCLRLLLHFPTQSLTGTWRSLP